MKTSTRPNILLIVSDQHKRSAMGCSGNPVVKTPNLDRLAAEGIYFPNAYTPSPLCAPARASLITGTHVHRHTAIAHQVMVGGRRLEAGIHRRPGYHEDLTTMGEHFREAGYRTAAIGKMHVHGETRENDMGFDERALRFYTYRYEDYDIALGKGDREKGIPKRLAYIAAEDKTRGIGYRNPAYGNNSGPGGPLPVPSILKKEEMFDEMVTAASIEFMEKHVSAKGNDQPFLLHIGLEKPHGPWTEQPEWIAMYPPESITDECLPPTRKEPFNFFCGTDKADDAAIRRGLAGYYACVSSMDSQVGKIMATLERLGIRDNTMVIYTTDHGEMGWEHRRNEKHNMYEASVNIPFIVSWPKRFPQGIRNDSIISLIDVLPTIADAAGLPQVPTASGRSLMPILESPKVEILDEPVFSEYYDYHFKDAVTGAARINPQRMVRTKEWKYIYTHGCPDQLYRLNCDELFLTDNQAAARPEVVKELKRYVLAGWSTEGYIGVMDEDPNVETMLGNCHLHVEELTVQNKNEKLLQWKCPSEIQDWDSVNQRVVHRSPYLYTIWSSEDNNICHARKETSIYHVTDAILSFHLPAGKAKRWWWVIAESENGTLAASGAIHG